MSMLLDKFAPRSAIVVLLVLTCFAVAAFAAVSHLVSRFNANQQSRGRRLYGQGLADVNSGRSDLAIEEFRAALTCEPANPQYQLSLGRALRDTGRLDEAESYLQTLWQRSPENGTVNLALARVAARRGSVDDAIRYYHNAMYGVWTTDADASRRKARIELIEFLLKKNARAQALAELVSLAAFSPPDPALHLETAQLFAQAQDYPNALSEYEKALHLDRGNVTALAGAGQAAYHAGRYRTALRYLQGAASKPSDTTTRTLLASANLIVQTDPFLRRISDAERNRRIDTAFKSAGERLSTCAKEKGISLDGVAAKTSQNSQKVGASSSADLATNGGPSAKSSQSSSSDSMAVSPLFTLHTQWVAMKRDLPRLRSANEADLPDAIMDLVFQIEQHTASECGEPHGIDEALLLIDRNREAADR